jgi:hypothetical protein
VAVEQQEPAAGAVIGGEVRNHGPSLVRPTDTPVLSRVAP